MLKSLAKRVLIESGATRIASNVAEKGIAILMYHSVVEDPDSQNEFFGEIGHSTSVFRQQMELIARDYHPISLDDALLFIQGRKDVPRRSVVITFDDGYADNYHVAVPLLNKIGIPATFYITVACVEQRKLPWFSRIRYALLTTKKSHWVDMEGQNWPLHEPGMRAKAFVRACEYCSKESGAEQDKLVASIECQLQSAVSQGPAMMTWDEARAMVKQRHIIGSHTMTHPNVAHIDENAQKRELAESKKILEKEIGSPILHFSYPCPALEPHWNEHTVAASRECGYQTGVTTDAGLAYRTDDPLHLRRVKPSKTVDGLRANLEFSLVGLAR